MKALMIPVVLGISVLNFGCDRFAGTADVNQAASLFRGFAVNVDLGNGKTAVMAFRYLEENIPAVLGGGWSVEPFGSNRLGFLVRPAAGQAFEPDQAAAVLAELRAKLDKVVAGQAMFAGMPEPEEGFTGLDANSEFPQYAGLSTRDPEWHLKFMDVEEAWEKIRRERGIEPGQGVVIGQVDTGLLPHPEIWSGTLPIDAVLWDRSVNFREREVRGAVDQFTTEGTLPVPSHGTATMSVMVSPRGSQMPDGRAGQFVTGVAPGAKVVPVRSTMSATILGLTDFIPIVDGVKHVVRNGAQIVMLPFGGRPDPWAHGAIRDAVKEGAIVFSAGGNHMDLVPWPGAYDEVVAVGAGTIECKPWEGATSGKAIDITAPGADVWHATSFRRLNGEMLFAVRRGVGTSFSTPIAAATAALWLSYHGWDTLAQRYGKENISKVFRKVLASAQGHRTCRGIVPGRNGAGFLNARMLLEAPLPESL